MAIAIIIRLIGVISLFFGVAAMANPTGATVVQGDVQIEQQGSVLEIHAADRAIIHWDDFSIDHGEMTRFVQPSESALVLNKVVGLNPSLINGVLEANGKVVLINPQGVLVGKEGIIRTSEFMASTLDILDQQDWSLKTGQESLHWEKSGCAALINHEGLIEATHVQNTGGRILLVAPEVSVKGSLCAEHGTVTILGDRVTLESDSVLDVSSSLGGGTVLIGGDQRGGNPEVRNSQEVHMLPGARIASNGLETADGGKIILWSDLATTFQGNISAEGGAHGGDGGFVEISSPGQLIFEGAVTTLAPSGKQGTLLLDPTNITIGGVSSGPPFTSPSYCPSSTAFVKASDIEAALGSNDVIISAQYGLSEPGLITWMPNFPISWNTVSSLKLEAVDQLTLNSSLTTTGNGAITLSSSQGLIDIVASSTSLTIQTGGPITITAYEALTFQDSTGHPLLIQTTTSAGAISLTSNTGDVSFTATADGIDVESLGALSIVAGDFLHLDSSGSSSLVIHVTSSEASQFSITNDFVAQALDSSHFLLTFDTSPLTVTAGGQILLHNHSPHVSGFDFIGIGASFEAGTTAVLEADSTNGHISITTRPGFDFSWTAGGQFLITNSSQSPAFIKSGGDLFLSSGQSFNITGQSPIGEAYRAYIQGGTAGSLTLESGLDIDLSDNAAIIQGDNAPALLIANRNFFLRPGSFIDEATPGAPERNAQLTLVVDNAYPAAPEIGPGGLTAFSGSHIFFSSDAPPVRIFTARQSQNTIDGTISTHHFIPGTFNVDTSTEHWSTYYDNAFVGPDYTVFYKEPALPPSPSPPPPAHPSFPVAKAQAVPGNVFDTINVLRYPMPAFQKAFCIGLSEKAKQRGYWKRPHTIIRSFDNDACFWVDIDNYRKYPIERKTHF